MEETNIKKNTIYNFIKTISSLIFPLITFSYTNRTLLPDNAGKVGYGMSIVSYFALLASLGISTYAIRECSKCRAKKIELERLASEIYSLNLVTTAIAYVFLIGSLFCFAKLHDYRILIIIQSVTIICTTVGADWLNSALEDFKYITIRTLIFQLIALCLMFIFVHEPGDYLIYALISVVSGGGAQLCNIHYRKRFCNLSFTTSINFRRHLTPIMFMFGMILFQTIFNNLDVTMIGNYIGDREVGIYNAAYKVMNIVNQVVASLLWVVLPRLSQYFEIHDYKRINALLRKVLSFYILIGLPCFVGIEMIAEDVVVALSGPEYKEAAAVLRILMIGFLFMMVGGNFWGNAVLLPSKKERRFMIICMVSTIVNVILNGIFIPRYGAKAAATTTAIAELIVLILLMIKRNKNIKVDRVKSICVSPVVGCMGIVLICVMFKQVANIWIRFIGSIAVSASFYFLINLLMKNEMMCELMLYMKNKVISLRRD